ncbi:MAG: energy-coupling factor transporter transmembrane component T [Micrococcus sp.]|nr:energy-coupling factor transporter transmembrane component T [Micrococcus sp.]
MITLYLPGNSFLHRTPAGLKLLVLAVWAVAVTLTPLQWWLSALALALPILAYAVAFGVPRGLRVFVGDVRALWLFYAVLFAFQWIVVDLGHALMSVARVLGMVLIAQALTRTTQVGELVSVTERGVGLLARIPVLGPWLTRLGLRPERVGLAMGLVMSSIGHLSSIASQVRQAQASRGVRLAPWAWVLPLLVLALKHADDVGDALSARGVE